jgi:hypothetical protein
MKYHESPPCLVSAAEVDLDAIYVSVTQWIMFGVHALPVDVVLIEPLLGDRFGKVGLILMVSHHYLYLEAMIAPFLYSGSARLGRDRPLTDHS